MLQKCSQEVRLGFDKARPFNVWLADVRLHAVLMLLRDVEEHLIPKTSKTKVSPGAPRERARERVYKSCWPCFAFKVSQQHSYSQPILAIPALPPKHLTQASWSLLSFFLQ